MNNLKDIVQLANEAIVAQRNELVYNRPEMMTKVIRATNKLESCILMKILLNTSLTQSANIYSKVVDNNEEFNQAYNNVMSK